MCLLRYQRYRSMVDFSRKKVLVWWALAGISTVCELRESGSFYPVAVLSQRPSLLASERKTIARKAPEPSREWI